MVQSKIKTSTKLLEELDKLLSKAGDDFGPIILEELKIRIDKTVNDFNGELSDLLLDSFKNYKKDCKDFKTFKENSFSDKVKNDDNENKNVPNFIKGHSVTKNKK